MLAVNILAQYYSKPTEFLMSCNKRVFRYLKMTKNFAVQYDLKDKCGETLTFYAVSDFGGEKKTRKSHSGRVGPVLGFMFMWNIRMQTCTALSTSEAEYFFMCDASSDIVWLRTLLAELSFKRDLPSKIFCDKSVWITWAETADSVQRANHIHLEYHFCQGIS